MSAHSLFIPASDIQVSPAAPYQFKIATMKDAAKLSRYAAGLFPRPAQAQAGLYELLVNAIEHGCYGIGTQKKAEIIKNRSWYEEIARRQIAYQGKGVDVAIARGDDGVYAVITDSGMGFDWRLWQSPAYRLSAIKNGVGHGISRCKRQYFSKVSYNADGNKVAALQAYLT